MIVPQSKGTVFKGAEEGGLLPECTSASYHLSQYKRRHPIVADKYVAPVKYKGYSP